MPKFEPPLLIEIRPSQYLLIFIVAVHILAILSSIDIGALLWVKLVLIALVCYSFYFHVQRYKHGYYLATIKYTKEFAWQLATTAQPFSAIQIINSSVITSSIIVLHVISENQHKNILICCDAVPNEVYRQLRVALKINAQNTE